MNQYFLDRSSLEALCYYETPLHSLNVNVARNIAVMVIEDLSRGVGSGESHFGDDRKTFQWISEVMSFALTLPLDEIEVIQQSTEQYVGWISDHINGVRDRNPLLLHEHMEHFFLIILQHWRNLFIPRQGLNVKQHSNTCIKVLMTIRATVIRKILNFHMCDEVLKFLLIIAAKVFGQPPDFNTPILSEFLGEELSKQFFFSWIAISFQHFPSDSLWLSFDDVCSNSIHNKEFVLQWASFCLVLTKKVLLANNIADIDAHNEPKKADLLDECPEPMDNKIFELIWIKFLYCIGNMAILAEPFLLAKKIWPNIIPVSMLDNQVPATDAQTTAIDPYKSIVMSVERSTSISFFNSMSFLYGFVNMMVPRIDNWEINFTSWQQGLIELSISKHKFGYHLLDCSRGKNIYLISSNADHSQTSFMLSFSHKTPDYVNLVDKYVSYCHQPVRNVYAKCSTVIAMVFDWLFEACIGFKNPAHSENIDFILKKNYDLSNPSMIEPKFNILLNDIYEVGRACAFHILLKLFSRWPDNYSIQSKIKARFYIVLSLGLLFHQHRAHRIFSIIVFSSSELFLSDLPSIEILVPHYLRALRTILVDQRLVNPNIDKTSLRKHALIILNSLIPLAVDICDQRSRDISSYTEVSNSFSTVISYVIDILCLGFEKETDNSNISMYLSAVTTLLFELIHEITAVSDYLPTIAQEMLQKLLNDVSQKVMAELNLKSGLKPFDLESSLKLIDIFISFASIPPKLLHGAHEVENLIVKICSLIISLTGREPQYQSKGVHSCIVYLLYCLTTWLSRHRWIILSKTCTESLLSIVELGLSGTKSSASPSDLKECKQLKPISYRVYEEAEFLMFNILKADPQPDMCQYTWKNLPEDDFRPFFMHYLFENIAIVSFVNILSKGAPTTIVFIRDIMGKRAYQFSFEKSLTDQKIELPILQPKINNPKYTTFESLKMYNAKTYDLSNISKQCVADTSFPTINSVLEELNLDLVILKREFENQSILEAKSYESYRKLSEVDISFGVPSILPPRFESNYDVHRMLLNNLFMTNYNVYEDENKNMPPRCYRISGKNIDEEILKLDDLSITNCHSIYLFIVNSYHKSVLNSLKENKCLYPESFNKLITELGECVTLKNHMSFHGSLKKELHKDVPFIYHRDPLHEMVIIPSYSLFENDMLAYLKNIQSEQSHASNPSLSEHDQSQESPKVTPVYQYSVKEIQSKKIYETDVIIIWAEDRTNTLCYPLKELVKSVDTVLDVNSSSSLTIIEISPMNKKMMKVKSFNFVSAGSVDQLLNESIVVVKIDYLAHYVRNLIRSMNMKKRVETDNYNSPHLKRKFFLQSITKENMVDDFCDQYLSNFSKNDINLTFPLET